MTYIDAFVLAVPQVNLDAYREAVTEAAAVWVEHGALSYTEAVGDDAPMGALTSFPRSVQLKEGEVVVLGWAVYTDRAARDDISRKVMSDGRMKTMFQKMGALGVAMDRMYFGGFAPIVEA